MKKLLTIAVAIMVLLGGSVAFAQEEKEPLLKVGADFTAGYGSFFAEEDETFAQDSQFIAGHVDILGVDLFDSTAGVGVEVQLGTEQLQYQVWSLNRAVVPGTSGRIYGGADAKVLQSTNEGGASADFDVRLVTGYRLADIGPGQLRFELRFIEENRPVAFALLYGF